MLLSKKDSESDINKIKKEIDTKFNSSILGISLNKLSDRKYLEDLISKKGFILKENTSFAVRIFSQVGLVDPKRFDYEVSKKYWYFVYLSDYQIFENFMKRYFFELEKKLKDYSALRPYYAFLGDKLNSLENKHQRYGTYNFNAETLSKVELSEMNSKRKSMNLKLLEDTKTKPVYLILGIPASGKDTQAALLAAKLNLPRLDAGSTFTDIIRNKQKYWEDILTAFDNKAPIPSEIFIKIISEKFKNPEYNNGFVLTQQSKSLEEAKEMISCLEDLNFEIKKVFYLDTKREVAIDRSIKRLNGVFTEKEPSIEAVVQRIDNYCKLIIPIKDYYQTQGILTSLDGQKTPEEISQEILSSL